MGTSGDEVRLRPAQGRGPGDRIESPYDSEARFRTKAGTSWTGYMVHLTETCDAGTPRLVVHANTTPANLHEAMRTGPIHEALATKGLAPSEHLVDAGYVSAEHLVGARERHGIDLIGPARLDQSWQKQVDGAFQATDFVVDWERRRVRWGLIGYKALYADYAQGQGRKRYEFDILQHGPVVGISLRW